MSQNSSIEWTESTWNPVTGCTPLSDGCINCYALRMAKRLKAMGNSRYSNGFSVTLHHDLIDLPLKWKKPRKVFVNSMSDLFHKKVPEKFIQQIFNTMSRSQQHTFQILTKRAERLAAIASKINWPNNVWMGVTVESGEYTHRIDLLRNISAAVKFLSIEPMIGPVENLDLNGIQWVIVGGESGPGSRTMKQEWVESIRDQCLQVDVPFFFKQWGGTNKKKAGRLINGEEWSQYPTL